MFVLKARNGTLFYLLSIKRYTVGRKECDLLITKDQSISRCHAQIFLKNQKIILVDATSRYGIFVNKQRVVANTEVELKVGDDIRFGQLRSYFTVEEIPIITTTSSIKGDRKKVLSDNISLLGGVLLSQWNKNCTHLTVEEILLTVKVLCAVTKGVPIVTLKYWDDYVINAKKHLPPPNVADYKPICSEVTLGKNISLDFNPERLKLFQNKVFVFPTKNHKTRMIDMIKLAGGDAISWDINPLTINDLSNPKTEYVILEMSDSTTENIVPSLSEIIKHNTQLGKRTIPLQEIALALMNSSCEKDCNPNFDRKGTVLALKTQQFDMPQTENILAMPTQSQNSIVDFPIEDIIQGTDEMDIIQHEHSEPITHVEVVTRTVLEAEQSASVKRENDPFGDVLCNVPKKIKLEPTKCTATKQIESMENTADPPGKSKFAFKRGLNVNKEQANIETPNPFAKKRKTCEINGVDRPSKKTSMPDETDNSLHSPTDVVNPFSFLRPKKASTASKEVSVSSTKATSKYTQNLASSTLINPEASGSLHLDISEIAGVDSNLEKSVSWMSKTKSDRSICTAIKSITTDVPDSSQKVDVEFLKYIDSFKNVLVIKEENMVIRRTSITSTSNNVSSHNQKNFKNFKKVQPLKIQTTIVPESSYVQIICNDRCAVQAVHEDSDNEDNDINRVPLQRRFAF